MERMEENLMTEAGEGDRIVADDQAQDEDEEGADPALKGSYDHGNPRGRYLDARKPTSMLHMQHFHSFSISTICF